MIEQLEAALRACPVTTLELFGQFCGRQWSAGHPPSADVWHAMAGVVEEALDDVRAEIDQLERDFDDEDGMGAIVPGV